MRKGNFLKFLSLIGLISLVCFFVKNVSASTINVDNLEVDSDFTLLDSCEDLSDTDVYYKSKYIEGYYRYAYYLYGYYYEDDDYYFFVEAMYLVMTPNSKSTRYPSVNKAANQSVSISCNNSDAEIQILDYSPETSVGSRTNSVSVGISSNSSGVTSVSLSESTATSSADIEFGITSFSDSFSNDISYVDYSTAITENDSAEDVDDCYIYTNKFLSVNITRIKNFSDFYYSKFTFNFSSYVAFYMQKIIRHTVETNSDDDAGLTSTTFTWRYKTPGGATGSGGTNLPHTIASTRN